MKQIKHTHLRPPGAVWQSSSCSYQQRCGLGEQQGRTCRTQRRRRRSARKMQKAWATRLPCCIVIVNTTQQAILTNLQNRELRRKVYMASIHRADGTDPKFNTFPIVTEIAKLRAEKGQLIRAIAPMLIIHWRRQWQRQPRT